MHGKIFIFRFVTPQITFFTAERHFRHASETELPRVNAETQKHKNWRWRQNNLHLATEHRAKLT